jgi:glycosyltransferase involved in cell wall biosynthesis
MYYIRNEENLGHLRNYNKGIGLSRGKYVWLISADDRLRHSYVLDRYVHFMNGHPAVGYVFCPGIGLQNGVETELLNYYYYGAKDKIFNGREFVATVLRNGTGILSPSVMVRRNCYETVSMFPLDMPHQGDVFLWFRWALEYDVAYLSEPMVNYRSHDLSMMKDFLSRRGEIAFQDEVNVLWRIKRKAEQKDLKKLARRIEHFIGSTYARAAAVSMYGKEYSAWPMSVTECDNALRRNCDTPSEFKRIRASFDAHMADKHVWYGTVGDARKSYILALRGNWRIGYIWLKLLLTATGSLGAFLRRWRTQIRRRGRCRSMNLVRPANESGS